MRAAVLISRRIVARPNGTERRREREREEDGRDAKSGRGGERAAFRALASVTRLRSARHSLAADRAARPQRYFRTYTAVDTRKGLIRRSGVTEDRARTMIAVVVRDEVK